METFGPDWESRCSTLSSIELTPLFLLEFLGSLLGLAGPDFSTKVMLSPFLGLLILPFFGSGRSAAEIR